MLDHLQEHWKAAGNLYPQKFEMSAEALSELNDYRRVICESLGFALRPGWEQEFQGVPIAVGSAGNCMVKADGQRVPI